MPCILVEVGFISNRRECKRLCYEKYINRIADGIVEGIRAYILELDPDWISSMQTRGGFDKGEDLTSRFLDRETLGRGDFASRKIGLRPVWIF